MNRGRQHIVVRFLFFILTYAISRLKLHDVLKCVARFARTKVASIKICIFGYAVIVTSIGNCI